MKPGEMKPTPKLTVYSDGVVK